MSTHDRPRFLSGISERDELSSDEYENDVRKKLASDLKLAIDAQTEFFSSWESPLARNSSRNLELITAIAERFLDSPEIVTEEWPVPSESLRRALSDARMLEIIRRTILKPTDILINVEHEVISTPAIFSYSEEEFLDRRVRFITDRILDDDPDHERELDRRRITDNLKERSVQEWEEIVRQEDKYLTEYLQGALNDQVQSQVESLLDEIAQRDKVTPETRNKLAALEQIAPLLYEGDLEGILAILKEIFGENTNFRTFVRLF